jgi:DNA-binding MarR family transcriptional regulator
MLSIFAACYLCAMPASVGRESPAAEPAASEAAREAWRAAGRLFMAMKPRMMAVMSELGLAPMQAHALRLLTPGVPQAMSALADALHCDNSNVTGIADRLEAAGLVERRPAPHDRRVKTLLLTPAGEDVRAEVERRMSTPPPGIAALCDADAQALRDILRRALGED